MSGTDERAVMDRFAGQIRDAGRRYVEAVAAGDYAAAAHALRDESAGWRAVLDALTGEHPLIWQAVAWAQRASATGAIEAESLARSHARGYAS